MSGRPDAAALEAARNLEEMKRMREIEEEILARAPENDIDPSLDRIRAVMELAGDPQRDLPRHPPHRHQRQDVDEPDDRRDPARDAACPPGGSPRRTCTTSASGSRLSGKPIPREKFIAAYDEVLPLIEIVDAPVARVRRPPDELLRGARRARLRRVRRRPGRRRRSSRSASAARGTRPTSSTPRSPS